MPFVTVGTENTTDVSLYYERDQEWIAGVARPRARDRAELSTYIVEVGQPLSTLVDGPAPA